MTGSGDPPFNVLLVDDDPADTTLAKHALRANRLPCQVYVARDGVEAMAFLRHDAPFADVPHPDLVLLDLNMPRKDGREVLKEMRASPDLKSIPVIVMTTSDVDRDVNASYMLGANSFITKPMDVDMFFSIVGKLGEYWFNVVRLPR
jgi:CheY-like chemotaxis protein